MCFNKLNKFYKIDFELKYKVDQLKIEKFEILSNLCVNVIVNIVDVVFVNIFVKVVEVVWLEIEYVYVDLNVQIFKRFYIFKRLILYFLMFRKVKKMFVEDMFFLLDL